MFRALPALILLTSLPLALAGTAADLADQVQHVTLDPQACYRVIDLNFSKEDLKLYLASGYLIFAKPVLGRRTGAVFVANAEGGDADVLLLPPTRSERVSLVQFTNSPNLEEHFKSAVFIFTDKTADDLLHKLEDNPASKKSQEMGGLIADHWTATFDDLISSFQTRILYDLMSAQPDAGFFYGAIAGSRLGNFDVLYDPTASDQIVAGKIQSRDNQRYFDTWTSFQARSFRNGAPVRGAQFALSNVRIDATIQPDLSMQAVTRAKLTFGETQPRSAIPFSLTPDMHVISAAIDGRAAEVFDTLSLRSDLIHGGGDRQFLLICDTPVTPGVPHEIEIHHEGAVIRDTGNQVYFVGSRGTWYPRTGSALADYDLTFRYPANLTIAATGSQVDDRTEGNWRITHVRTEAPVRFAGFNLGNFQSVVQEHNGYKIAIYANRGIDAALAPKADVPAMPVAENPFHNRHSNPSDATQLQPPASVAPNPAGRLEELTKEVDDTLDFMTAQFGPSPIRSIAVTPIPGGFGQGFPGLVYLSTLAYLNPAQLPEPVREHSAETFFSELLESHEVAHQWWGNLVIPATYHDNWLIEALANYSALLLIEQRKGVKALDAVLDSYRTHLMTKTATGRSIESAGPIVWGSRLESSLTPDAWRAVTYEKGTWIIHMLRRRLGDDKFLALLREVAAHHHSISTEQFRDLAGQYAPPSADAGLRNFFDNWVYGTGIPTVKLSYTWRSAKLSGSLAEQDVDETFSALVPLEVESAGQSGVYWLPAGSDPVAFSIPLKSPPTRVTLLASNCLMTVSK